MKLILASKSPRRREILSNLGLSFEVVTAETDETSTEKDPRKLVELLSERKGRAVMEHLIATGNMTDDTVILSSDTVVAAEGEILGKPRDEADARRMLGLLSGKTHEVVSGVCLLSRDRAGTASEVTRVTFDALDEETVEHYLHAEQVYDKAGAYAIQGLASAYIRGIEGCYFNVVGLPVHRVNCLYESIFGKKLL